MPGHCAKGPRIEFHKQSIMSHKDASLDLRESANPSPIQSVTCFNKQSFIGSQSHPFINDSFTPIHNGRA